MISLLLFFSFTFFAGEEEWTVYISDENPCFMGCVIPDYNLMYLDVNYLNQTDPWGNSLFEHELKHVLEPDWIHYKWSLD